MKPDNVGGRRKCFNKKNVGGTVQGVHRNLYKPNYRILDVAKKKFHIVVQIYGVVKNNFVWIDEILGVAKIK